MTLEKPSNDAPIASLTPLIGVILAALASSLAAAWGLAESRGWGARVEGVGLGVSAGLGVLAVAIAAIPGIALVYSPAARTGRLLGMRVMAAGAARLIITLFLGVLLLIAAKPEGYTFFAALTLAALACMLGETAWANLALRRTTITPGATVR